MRQRWHPMVDIEPEMRPAHRPGPMCDVSELGLYRMRKDMFLDHKMVIRPPLTQNHKIGARWHSMVDIEPEMRPVHRPWSMCDVSELGLYRMRKDMFLDHKMVIRPPPDSEPQNR